MMVIDHRIIRSTLDDLGIPCDLYFPHLVITDEALAAEFVRSHQVLADPTSDLEFDDVLGGLITAFISRSDSRPLLVDGFDDRAAHRAVEALQALYPENLSLDRLAAISGTDKYRLTRSFKRRTGLPPHAFQTNLRISAARRLLAGDMPLATVALECGFSSQSHFSRHFTRLMGIPPGQFRRLLRGNESR
jgi:AraC-like DNA-binding protein